LDGERSKLTAGGDGAKAQVLSRNGSIISRANFEAKGRQVGGAREGVATLRVIQLSTRHGGVVVANLRISHQNQGSSGVWRQLSDVCQDVML
jgi:hypothetical protein